MNKNTLFVILLLCSMLGFSQSFNYQAVVRNSTGEPIVNQSIGVQVQILEGAAPDTVVYTETHTVTSSAQGVISLPVGTGTTSDTFNTVNWSQQNQWIGIAVDITGGTTYTSLGTSKLQQVPYALYAASSGNQVFSNTANVTSNASGTIATDDFVFGGTQLNNDATTNDDDSRFFFDKSKAAFRAGITIDDIQDGGIGNQWDDANVGFGSVAMGLSPVATTEGAVSIGRFNQVTGETGFAMGNGNNVAGDYAGSLGVENKSNALFSIVLGANNEANSYGQTTIGYYNAIANGNLTTPIAADRLFVVGNGTFSNKSNALVMLKNGNTTLNGSLTIDGDNQGSGTSYTLPAQDGAANQVMTTDGTGNVSWAAVGEAFSTTSNVTSNIVGDIATDDFVFGSTQLANDTNTNDDNRRMFFDKSKGAFRVGSTLSTEWDDINVGDLSVAIGQQGIASGASSVAIGPFANALALESTAIGFSSSANGRMSVAIGRSTIAESREQITLGASNTIVTGNESDWVATDRLFVIGNGNSLAGTRSDALTILKNGNTTLNGSLTIDGDNQGTGTSYTLPAQDGTANQVMTTDGAGNVSWIDYGLEAVSSPTFSSGWENYSVAHGTGFEDARYYVDNGRVYLGGLIRKTSGINAGEIMLTLPLGYRPLKQRIFTVSTEAGIVRIDVAANGTVIYNAPAYNGGQNWVSLDGISFRID
ncbi:hypothetical protein [Aquimarina litoralis]|uniref:hypothetical protein n=1 Tax=Aquimarina litoralis TaxID=584605 RepID=UPI001C58126A|nr:hypothetical protein [Aquimarina litoralis]MBW1294133.1 hypothetical protein [Aquimarina litoralis]